VKTRRRVHQHAEGQILVLFAGGFAVFLVLVGLVVDGGFAFLNRRDAQNTADLAALAGTKVVADLYVKGSSPVSVYDAVDASARANDCLGTGSGTPCTWTASYIGISRNPLGTVAPGTTPPAGTYGVQVHVTRTPATFLVGPALRLMGLNPIDTWNVRTVAAALTYQSQQVAPAGAMLPIGWRAPFDADGNLDFNFNQVYKFTTGALDVPGNFGWLSWTGAGDTPTLEGWVCTPSNPQLFLPEYVDGNSGASNSAQIRACLQYYIDHKIPVLIPVIGKAAPPNEAACAEGPVWGHGQAEYCVVGVVSVILTNYTLAEHGNPVIKNIEGFVQQVTAFQPGVVPADVTGAAPPALNSKSYYLGLVQ
jgi:hypothetical protein